MRVDHEHASSTVREFLQTFSIVQPGGGSITLFSHAARVISQAPRFVLRPLRSRAGSGARTTSARAACKAECALEHMRIVARVSL
jgi:hypothetical protein